MRCTPKSAPAGAPEAAIALLDLEQAIARDYDQVADALLERYGRLDGLLHNAGILGTLAPIEHYDVPTWCRVMHVNVTAAFALTQVLMPALTQSADASVVFTSSAVGRQGRAYWGAYAVSKFALEGLSQVLAQELEGISHVRVNTLNPGRTRTRDAPPGLSGRGPGDAAAAGQSERGLPCAPGPGQPRGERTVLRCSAELGRGGRHKRHQLFLSQLAKLAAPERALECQRPQVRAHDAAHERPLTLKELPHLFAARAAYRERVPAVGRLPARSLAALQQRAARRCRGRPRECRRAVSR